MTEGQSRELNLADNYNSEIKAAKYMRIPNNYGKHVERIAEAAYETAARLRRKVMEKTTFEHADNPELLDVEIRKLALDEIPVALEDVSEHVEQAREYEEEIAMDDWFGESSSAEWVISRDEMPKEEQDFLDSYRKAEDHYRSIFEALSQETGEGTVVEFLEEEYGIDINEVLPEVLEPRMNRR